MRRMISQACLVSFACLALASLAGCAERRAPPEVAAPETRPYQLGPGDRVRVIVFGQEQLSNAYAVDGSGKIAMPLIGFVPAAGRTPAGLASDIEARLKAGFLREPRVAVEVEAYRPFFILGEVVNSGQYPFVNGMTVETAVAIAGGYTPRARKDLAQLTHVRDGRAETGDTAPTTPVRPGDTIYIPERFF